MTRIVNPAGAPASPVTATDKTDITAALATLSGNAAPTLDEVRLALPAGKRLRMTDGMIVQTAAELGLAIRVEA